MRPRGKLSFSRDVRLFFGALVGFLTFLIVLLLLLMQSFLGHVRDATTSAWNNMATLTVEVINETNLLADPSSLGARLTILQTRYGIAGITVTTPNAPPTVIGLAADERGVEQIVRDVHGGKVTLVFDASRLRTIERTFLATAVICLIACMLSILLVALYLPKITRPVEEMLSAASELEERSPEHDDQEYLTETFRNSIATLKRQEAELRQMHDAQKNRADDLERVTAALTRSLTSGFVAVDPEATVVEVNAAGRQIIQPIAGPSGISIESAFGENAFSAAIRRAVDERLAMSRVEVRLDDKMIGLTTAPLMSDDQKFVGLLALFTDLTPVRMLEGRVRDLQTLADLGEISAGIAHEFRNSLATMLGYLRLARRESLAEKPLAQIEKAEKEGSMLSAAVDGLLAFARPMKLVTAPVSLGEVIQPIAEELASSSGVAIEYVGGSSGRDATIEGDAALLRRAFENLLRNAVESVQEKGSGEVRIRITDVPHPQVEIHDTGMGVDPSEVPRLLLPFQSQKASGYGLGLPLARKIIMLHGGTLALRGAPGAGAVVVADFLMAEPVQFVTQSS